MVLQFICAALLSVSASAQGDSLGTYSGPRLLLTTQRPAEWSSGEVPLILLVEPENEEEKKRGKEFSPGFFRFALHDLTVKRYTQIFESSEQLREYRLSNGTPDSGEFYETVSINTKNVKNFRIVTATSLIDYRASAEETGVDAQRTDVVYTLDKMEKTFVSVSIQKKHRSFQSGEWKTVLDVNGPLRRKPRN